MMSHGILRTGSRNLAKFTAENWALIMPHASYGTISVCNVIFFGIFVLSEICIKTLDDFSSAFLLMPV